MVNEGTNDRCNLPVWKLAKSYTTLTIRYYYPITCGTKISGIK